MLLSLRTPCRNRTTAGEAAARRWVKRAEGVSLWLAMLLMLFVHPLYAEASETEDAGVLYLANGQSQWQEPALILDSRFEVSVSGPIAQTRLTRTFRNTSEQWQEGVFVFPLPEDATVFGFALKVGERKIVGQLQPREKARETYQKARGNGQKAALVEQQRPNLFTNRVANIPPGEQVVVELEYQQPVMFRHGEFELRLPTTLTPRYMPGLPRSRDNPEWQSGWALPTALVPDAASISPFTVRPDDVHPSSHRATVRVDIQNGLPLAAVDSPSHRLDTRIDGARADVRPEAGTILMDRDFVLRWRPLPSQQPEAAVFHQQWQGEDFLMAMVMPPAGVGPVLRRELVFVIDTSGSMAGESIAQARSALLRGLDTLRPGDRFNVIQFNSQAHALFSKPVSADANALARARQYVRGLKAEGGTEMTSALSLALTMGDTSDESRVRQRVFITDGAVGNESALFDQIRRDLGDQRLFTVGIGSAPNL
ncbi:MAG: marine proteobacterial sortase target protein, partial [Marinobacter sp. 34-60-7]